MTDFSNISLFDRSELKDLDDAQNRWNSEMPREILSTRDREKLIADSKYASSRQDPDVTASLKVNPIQVGGPWGNGHGGNEHESRNKKVQGVNDKGTLEFWVPSWGVEDYINERSSWQKSLYSFTGEPGFFYFKVFFKFNSNYGLLGGIMNNGEVLRNEETAIKYLATIKDFYTSVNIADRMLALYKFVGMLSYISSEAPWFFKEVNGLQGIQQAYTHDFIADRAVEIVCSEEAVDMRLGTLMDLYKYAAYDNILGKEIIPENLRKFDMSVIVFNMPLKYYHTAMWATKQALQIGNNQGTILNKALNALGNNSRFFDYKSMDSFLHTQDFSNTMSFKMYTFQNCEFDVESFNGYFKGSLSNESPFTLGKNGMRIKYDRVYEHRMNEWNSFLFGSDGFYYNKYTPSSFLGSEEMYKVNADLKGNEERLDAISKGLANRQFNRDSEQYKGLVDFAEAMIRDGLMDKKMKDYYSDTYGNLYGKFTDYSSEYQKNKVRLLKTGTIGGNLYDYDLGRTGYGSNRTNTEYLEQKIKNIHDGTVKGNIYGVDYMRTGSADNRKSTDYLKGKLSNLSSGTIKGNVFNYTTGREGQGESRKNSKYLDAKIELLKNGSMDSKSKTKLQAIIDSNATKNEQAQRPKVELTDKLATQNQFAVKQDSVLNISKLGKQNEFSEDAASTFYTNIANYGVFGTTNHGGLRGILDDIADVGKTLINPLTSFFQWK